MEVVDLPGAEGEGEGLSRRRFVQVCVGVATAAAAGSTIASIVGLRGERDVPARPRAAEAEAVCPVCSVGCGLLMVSSGDEPFPSRGDPRSSHTSGMVCDRGAFPPAIHWPSRLGAPLRRLSPATKGTDPSAEQFEELELGEAMEGLSSTLVETGMSFSPSARGCILGGGVPLEDAYVAGKLFKGVMSSGSIDSVESLHSRAGEQAYMEQLGEIGPPVAFSDVGLAGLIVLVGVDLATTHPVLYAMVAEAVLTRGTQLVVLDPQPTATATRTQAMHVPVRAGGEVALLNAIGSVLVHELEVAPAPGAGDRALNVDAYMEFLKLYAPSYDKNERVDVDYLRSLCDGPHEWVDALGNRDGQGYLKSFDVPSITGIGEERVRELARLWNRTSNVVTIWGSRISGSGDDGAAASTILNLHLLTDRMGRPGSGPMGLQASAGGRGAVEAGAVPIALPGGVPAATDTAGTALEAVWGEQLATEAARLPPGKGIVDMLVRAAAGELPVLLLLGGAVSEELPDRGLVEEALTKAYVVSNACHLEDPDLRYADLVLPSPSWYERVAHFISSERRVAISMPTLPERDPELTTFMALSRVGRMMVAEEAFSFSDPTEVMRELRKVTAGTPADMSALPLGHDLLEARGVQWPVATDRTAALGGTARRYLGQDGGALGYPTTSGKATILPREHPGLRKAPSQDFPLTAVVTLDGDSWWDGTFYAQSRGEVERPRQTGPHPVEVTREDASELGLAEGDPVLVVSAAGELETTVRLADEGAAIGHVFLPWGGGTRTQTLTPSFPLDRNGVPPWAVFSVRLEPVPPSKG